jgi:amidohydrolase
MMPGIPLLVVSGVVSFALLAPATVLGADVVAARAQEIAQAAQALSPELVKMRRDLHMHPELSNREERTARIIAERLRALGFDEVTTNVAKHGLVALLHGARPGPVVAVRADMDALPINESINVPYKSLVPGVKHACGHDAHTAIGLGVAHLLSQRRGQVAGTVKFLFQPAEEGPPPGEEGGAALMIKAGALENPRPSAIFGLHTSPEIETGLVGYRAGPAQAAADSFSIIIHGKMAHAAFPESGVDPILVAAHCVTALQSIKSRRMDAFEPMILTIGTIHGGERQNTIPGEVRLTGTIRTFSDDAQARVERLMRETLAGVTAAYRATFDLQFDHITTVVYNDPKLVEQCLPWLRAAVGPTNVFEAPKRMGAEDFSFYEQVVPGFFLRLGCGNKAKGITALAHTPDFDIDEDCLVVGVKALSNLVLDYLDRHANSH